MVMCLCFHVLQILYGGFHGFLQALHPWPLLYSYQHSIYNSTHTHTHTHTHTTCAVNWASFYNQRIKPHACCQDHVHESSPYIRVLLGRLRVKVFPLSWDLNVHYHVHKSLPLVPILSQINPIYNIHSHILFL
jgi:hypothetical protein